MAQSQTLSKVRTGTSLGTPDRCVSDCWVCESLGQVQVKEAWWLWTVGCHGWLHPPAKVLTNDGLPREPALPTSSLGFFASCAAKVDGRQRLGSEPHLPVTLR
jgi:hypothetical protein